MSNMSYCRFQNTLKDLNDCIRHLWDEDLSAEEERGRNQLILACLAVAEQIDVDDVKDLEVEA